MKIINTAPISSKDIKLRKVGGAAGGVDFASFMDLDVEETGASLPTSAIASVNILNEVEDSLSAPRKAVKRAFSILDELENLRDALLFGTITVPQLERIQLLLARRDEHFNSPDLAEIINEIEVRAAVELAKLGRF